MSKEVAEVFAGGRWTLDRYRAFIRSALQKAWMRYPVKQDALVAARRPATEATLVENPRVKFEYHCNSCKKWFVGKDVQVDHINDCGDIIADPGGYLGRMFCEVENLQVLCKWCHRAKKKPKS